MIGGRTLVQVLGLYAAGSWLVLQVVDVLKDNMGLPDWVFPFAFVLLLIGLPIIFTTAVMQKRLVTPYRASDAEGAAESGLGSGSENATSVAPTEIRGLFRWRNALLGGGLAFLFLALATGAFMYMRGAGIGPVGSLVAAGVLEEKAKVVLADFEAEDETLGRTVTESFRVDLAQSPIIRLVGPDSIADALARMGRSENPDLTEETARELAQRDGIPAVIAGEVSPVGSGYAHGEARRGNGRRRARLGAGLCARRGLTARRDRRCFVKAPRADRRVVHLAPGDAPARARDHHVARRTPEIHGVPGRRVP